MKVSFQLTMPNNSAWNGKWTGADKLYYHVKTITSKAGKDRIMELLERKDWRSWYYNFGDGWGAAVKMEIVEANEARRRAKQSSGFCGYEWMIDSILKHGKIIVDTPVEREMIS